MFRSVPDHWALDQLFRSCRFIISTSRQLNTRRCDITCDSDGIVDKFVDLHDVKQVLGYTLNPDEPYYLAFMLVGAYQEVMGNNHNLLARRTSPHTHR